MAQGACQAGSLTQDERPMTQVVHQQWLDFNRFRVLFDKGAFKPEVPGIPFCSAGGRFFVVHFNTLLSFRPTSFLLPN